MAALLIGYARCSTDQQDLTAQRDGLTALGVAPARIYVDHGLTGTTRDRPGLREAMAACREGDTLVGQRALPGQRNRRPHPRQRGFHRPAPVPPWLRRPPCAASARPARLARPGLEYVYECVHERGRCGRRALPS